LAVPQKQKKREKRKNYCLGMDAHHGGKTIKKSKKIIQISPNQVSGYLQAFRKKKG
jgi:hypothetical protein